MFFSYVVVINKWQILPLMTTLGAILGLIVLLIVEDLTATFKVKNNNERAVPLLKIVLSCI